MNSLSMYFILLRIITSLHRLRCVSVFHNLIPKSKFAFNFFFLFSVDFKMFSKTQKATDKMRLFLQNKVDCSVFLRFLSMSHKKSSKIQAIYDLCKKSLTPANSPLSSQTIKNLCSLLGNFSFLLWSLYCIIFYIWSSNYPFVSSCDSC